MTIIAGTKMPEALVSTPSAYTVCPDCECPGVRYDEARLAELHELRLAADNDDGQPLTIAEAEQLDRYESAAPTFAHCPRCGSTELLDVRSPFEVLDEANRNIHEVGLSPEARLGRYDVADRVARVVAEVTAEHLDVCGDCATWARIVGVR